MYQVGIARSLRARHALSGDFGDESRPHEHVYRVEWSCAADDLDADGFAVDISLMEQHLEKLAGELDGMFLNELSFFRRIQVSVENLSRYLFDTLMACLDANLRIRISTSEIKVWESETAWASYSNKPGVGSS